MKNLLFLAGILFSNFLLAQKHVGIGTSNPLTALHVVDSSVMFSANGEASLTPGNLPIEGQGRRMMWYADKGAFRVGYVSDNTYWHKDSIGAYSFASGFNTQASGWNSTALGVLSLASGESSTSIGYNSEANGVNSIAIGYGNKANGFGSIAMGFSSVTNGRFATTLGIGTWASAREAFTIGSYNDLSDNPDPNTAATTDRIFQIGIGTNPGPGTRKNALTVLRNGNIGIGVLAPQYILDVNGRARLRYNPGFTSGIWYNNSSNVETVFAGMNTDTQWGLYGGGWKFLFDMSTNEAYKISGSTSWIIASDARLKENVHPYTDGLREIMQIDPVWFNYKKTSGFSTAKSYVGVIAQDLQKTAPYMVGNFKKNGQDLLNIDNSAMTYMLINAVKEQQAEIEVLKKENQEIKALIKSLR